MAGHSKWSNIKHRKGAQDAKRGKLFTKLGKELTIAAKEAGGDPNFNPRLRLAIDKAKAANMPKDNLERAIKKGTGELDGVDYMEIRYEGYGPEGTAFIVEVVTDNKNRSASEVRAAFSRRNGNLGTDGAVSWMFQRKGEIIIPAEGIDADELMMAALEAGAEDVKEEDGEFTVLTDSADCNTVAEELKKVGYNVTEAEVAMIPDNKVQITDLDTAKKVMALYEALDDLDDVNDVYSNFDISDELLEQL
ncbi:MULTISPECIES: YebC/PmpR family DNA-binding transcriptional regulator [Cetobacterium]|uniref:Probable transcriptional regulatory protein RFV38_09290 n=1 Tax=Candidatus Cetobacterium colombiensis TaxID=3073100 RepID=A0ABU4WAX0_9FUSO|nr:YebC/PmpR family DNA-binding transcriptional regulator [Candidatus Cetobacterium colombiensis]MDX8336690.1 YebC/PmpR family DNA-binding transcriptional regulator [Candidatus Cetobacterium colombiensis]